MSSAISTQDHLLKFMRISNILCYIIKQHQKIGFTICVKVRILLPPILDWKCFYQLFYQRVFYQRFSYAIGPPKIRALIEHLLEHQNIVGSGDPTSGNNLLTATPARRFFKTFWKKSFAQKSFLEKVLSFSNHIAGQN